MMVPDNSRLGSRRNRDDGQPKLYHLSIGIKRSFRLGACRGVQKTTTQQTRSNELKISRAFINQDIGLCLQRFLRGGSAGAHKIIAMVPIIVTGSDTRSIMPTCCMLAMMLDNALEVIRGRICVREKHCLETNTSRNLLLRKSAQIQLRPETLQT